MIVLALAIGIILRFYGLATIPPAFDWDEASTTYNAYSILKTGRDEYGQKFPVLFKAYDAYVPPLLIYLNVPSVALFGLTEFAGRLPVATLGVLSIPGIYLLVREISKSNRLAALSALFLAISPWHLKYSRVDFLPSVPAFFIIFGTFFFLKSLKKKGWLVLSGLFFSLSIFSYYSAYIFVPLFGVFLSVWYFKKLRPTHIFLFLTTIFASAILLMFVFQGGQRRLRGVTYFFDQDVIKQETHAASNENFFGRINHNRRYTYGQKFLEGYFENFRFDFLFGEADAISRISIPPRGYGLLYLWELPFLLLGLYLIFRQKNRELYIILAWLLLAPVAASIALPQPTSTRAIILSPALIILSAYGFWKFTKTKPKILTITLLLLLAFNFYLFVHQYFVHFNQEKSAEWFYGFKELFQELSYKNNSEGDVYFIFRRTDDLNQIHMFTLFYNKIDPKSYQAAGGTKMGCVGTAGQFGFERYHFIPVDCLNQPFEPKQLKNQDLVVTSRPTGAKPLKTIYNLDSSPSFYVYRADNREIIENFMSK